MGISFKFSENEKQNFECPHKSGLVFLIYINIIIQFTRELRDEVIALLNQ
jgi:hypothetical protein